MISFKKVTCVNSVLTGHLLEATWSSPSNVSSVWSSISRYNYKY
jgi:hypothetical protein